MDPGHKLGQQVGWKICIKLHGGLKEERRERDEPDGGGEAHAAPVTSKAALLAFWLLFTTFLWSFSGISHISTSFDRNGDYAIGHARPLRPNQRMDHLYISTGIDWAPNYIVESLLEPFPVERGVLQPNGPPNVLHWKQGNPGPGFLDTFESRPLGWRMEGFANIQIKWQLWRLR
ncbi:uncharacterized protein N7496_000898 [Penicillium cataractarum]|uniref:Uncharacterized protein n=1 Tax=Penicillium cataractarum TaxID=2100454 RepID=A0A9W9VV95_9EURO|nr:uncharacterized protein N7496_000898 [Penicillium cataractarum]KAJ5389830.1 hypothetical protein N7496_000898 [Penicillium cataractarum]